MCVCVLPIEVYSIGSVLKNRVLLQDMSQVDGCGLSGGSDEDDECASSPTNSAYDDSADIIKNAMSDEVTKQLAAAGQCNNTFIRHNV